MRKIARAPLPPSAARYLSKKQAEADALGPHADTNRTWKSARKTKHMGTVLGVLREMARNRERCMFCEDSRGTDIEHFRPKSKYPARLFSWENLLLVCTGCNRLKEALFPLDDQLRPLLIDPTSEDPWDHLYCVAETGELAPRWKDGAQDSKGKETIEVLPLRDHAITEGRAASCRNLERAARAVLGRYRSDLPLAERDEILQDFLRAVEDSDSHEMGQWCFCRDGQESEPFTSLRRRFPDVWKLAQHVVMR